MSRSATALLLLAGCNPSTTTTEPAKGESPQASAQPAPLAAATTPASGAPVALVEGGPPPAPLRGDEVLGADAYAKEGVGYTLSGAFRQADLVGPQRALEVSTAGIEAARKASELRVAIDFSASRLKMTLETEGFMLPNGTEIRARSDRYGHVVVWPGGATYRPLAPGGLRALFGERRYDVAPITPADLIPREEGGRRLGIRTHRVDVTTRAAQASFEIGHLDGAAEGGVLLCRLLLDLMNAPPSTPLCQLDELPVRAEFRWVGGAPRLRGDEKVGSLFFELTAALEKAEMPSGPLLTPPADATFAASPLPTMGVAPMLTASELAALRTVDVDVPPTPGVAGDTLLVQNTTMELRELLLDGVPVAWAAPNARGELHGLKRGRYVGQWRTFLGDAVEAPSVQTVPGISTVGTVPDAGR